MLLVVDGANVVGARPDGWWRDRAAAVGRLHAGLARLVGAGWLREGDLPGQAGTGDLPGGAGTGELLGDAGTGELPGDACEVDPQPGVGTSGVPVVLVVEGSARSGLPAGRSAAGIDVVHAAGSGDDEVIAQVRAAPGPVLVVTADRLLRARVAAEGGEVVGPGWLWARIDAISG